MPCFRKWKTLHIERDGLVEQVMAALAQDVFLWRDPQYIPLPMTWLNQERYDRDIEAVAKALPKPEPTPGYMRRRDEPDMAE